MAYYNICNRCGATLDPGETCDCEVEEMKRQESLSKKMEIDQRTGQYSFRWDGKEGYRETEAVG